VKKSRFTERQRIGVLKQHQAGMKMADLYREHETSAATFYGWKSKHGDLQVSEAQKPLRQWHRALTPCCCRAPAR
jgi:putative transposase